MWASCPFYSSSGLLARPTVLDSHCHTSIILAMWRPGPLRIKEWWNFFQTHYTSVVGKSTWTVNNWWSIFIASRHIKLLKKIIRSRPASVLTSSINYQVLASFCADKQYNHELYIQMLSQVYQIMNRWLLQAYYVSYLLFYLFYMFITC